MTAVWVDHSGWVEGDMEVYMALPWPSAMCTPPGTTKKRGKLGHIWRGVYEMPNTYPGAKQTPWGYRCPAPLCFWNGAYKSRAEAERIRDTHQCPWYGGGKTVFSWSLMGEGFIEPIWKKLDVVVDRIKDLGVAVTPELVAARGEAKGLCQALAILMPPFFTTWEAIAQEAAKRRKAREEGNEEYCTPGTGRFRWKTPDAAKVLDVAGFKPVQAPTEDFDPSKRGAGPRHNLTPEQVAKIKQAAAAGFEPATLATSFGVTTKVIESLIK